MSRHVFPWVPGATLPYSLLLERHLTVSEGEIELPGLHHGFDGAKVLLITDVHAGPFLSPSSLESALARLLTLKPDVILLGGDLATSSLREIEPHIPILRTLEAPLGVFMTLGNHDHYTREAALLRRRIEEAGIRVLHNTATLLTRGGGGLLLAGIDDYLVGEPDLDGALATARSLDDTAPIVLLSHNPDVFFEAARRRVALVLSGHTHGGQMRIPGMGVLVRMSRYRLDEGRYRAGGAEIVVSRGLGVSGIPFRSACPPEGLMLTLRCVHDRSSLDHLEPGLDVGADVDRVRVGS